MMRNEWVKRNKWIFFVGPLAGVAFVWLFGELVMHLWNWLLPALFGWHPITFWQTLGLVLLCRILFGSWGSNADNSKSRRSRTDRSGQIAPEERESFGARLRAGCGDFGRPASGTNEPA
jgi:hypothetical protein